MTFIEKDKASLSKKIPTKETTTKELLQKKKPMSQMPTHCDLRIYYFQKSLNKIQNHAC